MLPPAFLLPQARAAGEANEAERQRIQANADGKAARVEYIMAERKGLAQQQQRVRHRWAGWAARVAGQKLLNWDSLFVPDWLSRMYTTPYPFL